MQLLTKWLNKLVKALPLILGVLSMPELSAQTITLNWAYQRAEEQYPLAKQKDLVRQTADMNIENLRKGYLPQIVVNGQVSYQSAVTAVPITIPGVKIESPDKDQYKVFTDISQVIYDGGLIKQQQELQELNATVEEHKIEVELHQLRERITQLYLGAMLLQAQVMQVELVKNDLKVGLKTIEAQVANELVLRSNLNILKAELLKADQRVIELKAARKGFLDVLGLLLNQDLPEQTVLMAPAQPAVLDNNIMRPELELFKGQSYIYQQQKKLVDARNRPRTSAFVQGGYGRPALNMLKNEFEPYYIAGLRLNWSLSGMYTSKKEKRVFDISQKMVEVQKELFLLNTNTQLKQQYSEIEKWNRLIETDQEIIELRTSVKEASKAQLENRVITANDYLREVNAEDVAKQNLTLHQIQLLQAQINYQNILGSK